MALSPPNVRVNQAIPDEQTAAEAEDAIPFIIGPDYAVHKYTADNPGTLLGEYGNADLPASWPGRQAGEVVDQDFTRVFLDDARLQYYEENDICEYVAASRNRVRSATRVFATANGVTRSAQVPTDVRVGDHVRLEVGAGDVLMTTVQALIAEVIADTIEASPTAGGSNQAATTESDTVTPGVGNAGDDTLTVDTTVYDPIADNGLPEDTYDFEVTTAGAAGVAVITATRASDGETFEIPVSAFATPLTVDRGLTVSIADGGDTVMTLGDTWSVDVAQDYTAPAVAGAGDYVGSTDTVYRIEVTRTGDLDGNALTGAQIRVTTLNGIDASGPHYPVADTPLAIGNLGVTVEFDSSGTSHLVVGDTWTVTVTAESAGGLQTLQLANDVPVALQSGPLDLRLSIIKDIEVPENRIGYAPVVNWEQSETEITLKAGILANDARVQSGSVLVDLPVWYGRFYVTYRALKTVGANTLQAIADDAGLPENTVLGRFGTTDPDSVLPFGIVACMDGAGAGEVRYISIASDDLAGYQAAISAISNLRPGHGFVPLTYDRDVQLLIQQTVNARTDPTVGRPAVAWFAQELVTEQSVYVADSDGAALQAVVGDDPGTSGTQYTLLTAAGGLFITNEVQAGDIVRIQYTTDGFGNDIYSEYVVDAVLTEETLRLTAGPSSEITLATKFEVWRNLDEAAQVAEFASRASSFDDELVRVIFPPAPKRAGVAYPSFYLAATLAGLRSALRPHAPMSNVDIPGWDDLSQAAITFGGHLNTLLDAGVWVVTQDIGTAGVTGAPFTYRQVTTDQLQDLRRLEDSIVQNRHDLVRQLNFRFRDSRSVVGRRNIYPGQLERVLAQIESVLSNNEIVQDEDIGPQIIRYTVLEARRHLTLLDRFYYRIRVTVPTPLNEIEIDLEFVI